MNDRDTPPATRRASSGQVPRSVFTSPPNGSTENSTVAPSSERTSPSQQSRRLQLRNAGFRGQTLPIRRISPILSSSILSPESYSRVVSHEKSPHNLDKRQLYGEDLPPNPVNILQELHDSARRKRNPPRRSIGEIFQDGTATATGDGDCGLSWYSETGNNNSPLQLRSNSATMTGLREVSSNSQTPPSLSSPLTKQARARKGNRVNQRSTSAEAAKYIEHLESQLVAVNTKLDSLMSPTAHKTRAAKLRALTSEARFLRQQVSDWEQKFDERVKNERIQLAEMEISLTSRLQSLEDEVEAKDGRVKDMEWEISNLKSRVKDAEGLEVVNADLERRIDLLTNLLVQSPTKLDLSSATSSPSKPEPHRRITRPRSMMPRIPPSPGSLRLSLNITSDMQFRRSRRSFTSTSSGSPSSDVPIALALEHEQLQATGGLQESKESTESGSGNSSFRSPPSSSSRPTSLYSNSSFGAYSWGLPLPPDMEAQFKAGNKQRRMRRFPPGAATLKPLLLPTATGTPSLPTSPPVRDTFGTMPQRGFSETSMDPTVAFLSKCDFTSPVATPTQSGRRHSSPYVQTEALCALEGRSSMSMDRDDSQSILSPRSISEEPLETVEEESSDDKLSKRERPRSLGEELEEVGMLFRDSFDDGLIPHSDGGSDQNGPTKVSQRGIDTSQPCTPVLGVNIMTSGRSLSTPGTRRAPPKLASPLLDSNGLTAITTSPAYGLMSRLKNLMLRTKQGPPRLAHRLIHNAWAIGIAKLGGLGWWLLGLVYRHRSRKKKRVADVETTVEEVPFHGSNWHHSPPETEAVKASRSPGEGLYHVGNYPVRETPAGSRALNQHHSRHEPSSVSGHESHFIPCSECKEPSSRRSFRLWLRFSLAIVLAVGIAIKDGPGALLEECHKPSKTFSGTQQLTPLQARSTTGRAPREDGLGSSNRGT
ncbi:MAG: hypothetical protein Q9170_003161 [Blastenia crenularia]